MDEIRKKGDDLKLEWQQSIQEIRETLGERMSRLTLKGQKVM